MHKVARIFLIFSTILECGNALGFHIRSARIILSPKNNRNIFNNNGTRKNMMHIIKPIKKTVDNGANLLTSIKMKMWGYPDKKVGEIIEARQYKDPEHLEELGTYFEGDMLIPQMMRTAVRAKGSYWPYGIVPYEIRGDFTKGQTQNIEKAIEKFHEKTCVRFVKRRYEKNFIKIKSGKSGCWSNVGKPEQGHAVVNLQRDCAGTVGTILHELMHILGFVHEQNRPDRDKYIEILFENVNPNRVKAFELIGSEFINSFGLEYDYGSIMHYSPYTFSKNGKITIRARKSPELSKVIGQRKHLSKLDIERVNRHYKCGIL